MRTSSAVVMAAAVGLSIACPKANPRFQRGTSTGEDPTDGKQHEDGHSSSSSSTVALSKDEVDDEGSRSPSETTKSLDAQAEGSASQNTSTAEATEATDSASDDFLSTTTEADTGSGSGSESKLTGDEAEGTTTDTDTNTEGGANATTGSSTASTETGTTDPDTTQTDESTSHDLTDDGADSSACVPTLCEQANVTQIHNRDKIEDHVGRRLLSFPTEHARRIVRIEMMRGGELCLGPATSVVLQFPDFAAASELGRVEWTVRAEWGWQGADFDVPIEIDGAHDIYIGMSFPPHCPLSIATAGTDVRGLFNPAGSFNIHSHPPEPWMYRIYCCE